MPRLIRFGVSFEKEIFDKFEVYAKKRNYTNRSEAIRDLIREALIKEEWEQGKETAGAITLIYDHHRRELVQKLVETQHDFHEVIISAQHIHLDHYNCLEIIAVKGRPKVIENLKDSLGSIKGVKHATLSMSSTGKNIA